MKSQLHYTNIIYLTSHHILAVYALYHLSSIFSYRLMLELILSIQMSGMLGITAGAHRLWSHKSYEAAWPVRLVFMLANSAAHQGSIYQWTRDHRMHHKHTDTELDPHSIQYGFWYSHVGWIFFRKTDEYRKAFYSFSSFLLYSSNCLWKVYVEFSMDRIFLFWSSQMDPSSSFNLVCK